MEALCKRVTFVGVTRKHRERNRVSIQELDTRLRLPPSVLGATVDETGHYCFALSL
jgi:hypothetical protein